MNGSRHGRTVVLGLGNPVLCDDRVGLAVADAVERLLRQSPAPDVDILTSTRGGFHLIDILQGYARAILIDCWTSPVPKPGRVRRLNVTLAAGSARLVSPHDISIAEAFRFAALLSIPMPEQVTIYAVEAADTETLCESMTPLVEAAVEPLARRVSRLVSGPGCARASRRSAGIRSDGAQRASPSQCS